ncbi:MAG: glutathione synthase [Myxococcota bacterium]
MSTFAFVMDPIESVSIDEDTSFVLMLEAQNRGHEVLYIDPAELSVSEGRPVARVTPVSLRREHGNHVDKRPSRLAVLDEEVDVAFQRVDPPVDADYIAATQILDLCRQTIVLNAPRAVLAFNEKLFALRYADLMPETIVTRRAAELRDFQAKMGGRIVVKPLDGKGGEGIFQLLDGDPNLSSILEQATSFDTRWAMGQQFMPEVSQGDKRILLLEGEVLGALLRVPADGDLRANLHVGARAVKTEITPADQQIVERLGPDLKAQGLFFVGIDVIGGKLTEINVTSPTGMQEIDRLDGVCLETQVIERVEEKLGS